MDFAVPRKHVAGKQTTGMSCESQASKKRPEEPGQGGGHSVRESPSRHDPTPPQRPRGLLLGEGVGPRALERA